MEIKNYVGKFKDLVTNTREKYDSRLLAYSSIIVFINAAWFNGLENRI